MGVTPNGKIDGLVEVSGSLMVGLARWRRTDDLCEPVCERTAQEINEINKNVRTKAAQLRGVTGTARMQETKQAWLS